MSKRINAEKLLAMGKAKVKEVCIHHAERALEFREQGNKAKFNMHCALLDQCAEVGRALNGKPAPAEAATACINRIASRYE